MPTVETTAFIILDKWNPSFVEQEKAIAPQKCLYRHWIPQTAYDSVWVFYDFETKEEKAAYLAQLPKDVRVGTIDQRLIDHWFKGSK